MEVMVKMLITLSLLILGVLTIFSLVLGENLSGTMIKGTWSTDVIVNGSVSTIEFGENDLLFIIDPTVLGIAAFVVIAGIAALLGITVFSTGLSAESVKIIMACTLYGVVWILLSIFAMPLILSIEIFGVVIYTVLLIMYIVGVIQAIVGGEVA